jgi:putative RNA 2'-phosphotransferase
MAWDVRRAAGMALTGLELSRAVARALREVPWLYELEFDQDGWAAAYQVVAAVREDGERWRSVDVLALERAARSWSGGLYEFDRGRVRAVLTGPRSAPPGPGRPWPRPASPPDRLFHGTALELWPVVRLYGLAPLGRKFVHLSVGVDRAWAVARRKSDHPMVLEVDSGAAARAGIGFYEGNEMVWLADKIPSRFVKPLGS